jgi:thiol-disulfide isomerase/thioredoxin
LLFDFCCDTTMTQTQEAPKAPARFPLGKAILATLVVGVVGALYVVFSAASNDHATMSLDRFASGALEKLEVIPEPPEQPSEAFLGPDGAQTTLAAYRGEVVLVNLWATWCPPCVKEMPTLAALQRDFAGQKFRVVAISVDRAAEGLQAKAELDKLTGGALAFYHDPNYAVVYPMKARGFPTSVLYDASGREVARLAGDADWSSPEAKALISAVLTGDGG